MEIRSYRRVFDLERRIYRIDRVRVNPGGIPVRSLLYILVSLFLVLMIRALPLLGAIERMLPWYVADLALPVLAATLLTAIRIEGRPFHLAAIAMARYACGPRVLADAPMGAKPGSCWHPGELLFIPDGSDARLRRLRYTGPGAALVAPAHERVHLHGGLLARLARRPDLAVIGLPDKRAPKRARVIELAPGARLTVR